MGNNPYDPNYSKQGSQSLKALHQNSLTRVETLALDLFED